MLSENLIPASPLVGPGGVILGGGGGGGGALGQEDKAWLCKRKDELLVQVRRGSIKAGFRSDVGPGVMPFVCAFDTGQYISALSPPLLSSA